MAFRELHNLLAQLESDLTLFESDQLRRRIDALDLLDGYPQDPRAEAMRVRLEAVNAAIYRSIRSQILSGAACDALLSWIDQCADQSDSAPAGLHFDCLDELIGGVLQLREPDSTKIHPAPEMVFYQPTPARHILYMLRLCALTGADTLVDLGSGLGHVPILASLLTDAKCIGIELESAYIESASKCAESLGLNRAAFLQQDARDADLSTATVVYLYTPFTGSILGSVLGKLRDQSAHRQIRICTLGPCTEIVARQSWTVCCSAITEDQIALFHARS